MRLIYLVVLMAALGGCAPAYSINGTRTSERRYTEEDDVPNPPKGPPSCRVTDAEEVFVEVECDYLGNPTRQDWKTGIELEYHRAAETAVVSGKAYVVRVTSDGETHYLTSHTPVRCQTVVNPRKVIGNFLTAIGNANRHGTVDMDCSTIGNGTSCSGSYTEPPPPAPLRDPHDTTCSSGETYRVISGVTTVAKYRMLSEQEGSAPDVQLLPMKDRPLSVRAILAPPQNAAAAPNPDPWSDQ
jgi:hypothetical protein